MKPLMKHGQVGNAARVPTGTKDDRPLGKDVVALIRAVAPTPSEVYDTYWRFAHERQEVFFRRLDGRAGPWTSDPILQKHRFTNVYRASDRVSQYLIRRVIYGGQYSAEDTLFRVLLFKFFNRIDTWEMLERELGEIRWCAYAFTEFDRVLTRVIDQGKRIYSAAYIMPACAVMGAGRKHRGHLKLIDMIIRDGVATRLATLRGMGEVFALLRSYPMLGAFLSYQFAIDLNYSQLTDFSENEFVVPGPGARDGLRKVFTSPGDYNEADLIRWVVDRQDQEFDRLGLAFRTLWGRRLQLIDCQNLFCEVDKYARVRHPSVSGLSGRTRIKQKYTPAGPLLRPWYPPKWGLNNLIEFALLPSRSAGENQQDLFAGCR